MEGPGRGSRLCHGFEKEVVLRVGRYSMMVSGLIRGSRQTEPSGAVNCDVMGCTSRSAGSPDQARGEGEPGGGTQPHFTVNSTPPGGANGLRGAVPNCQGAARMMKLRREHTQGQDARDVAEVRVQKAQAQYSGHNVACNAEMGRKLSSL